MEQQVRFCTAADGVRIAYATVGSGPPLVKAANWLNHLEYDWQSPIWRPLFEELARDFTFVRYDERGNGLSDWKAELSLDAFVHDLEAVVDAAGLEKFALLGISQGGAVAVQYAVRHPERVTHLILHGAYARGWGVRGNPEETERRRVMMDLIRLGWGQDNPAFRQLWTTLYIPDGTPEQMRWFNEMQRVSTSPEIAIRLFDTFAHINVEDALPQVRTPTLVTHARGDAAVPYEAGRQLAARIPGARLVTLETSNHLILQGEPAWLVFVGEIRNFLGVERALASAAPLHQEEPVWPIALDKIGDVLDRTPGGGTPPAASPGPSAAAGPAPRLSPGDTLAHYRILSALGAGGMGQVYRARDTRLERDVALKLLAEGAPSDSARHRLLAEARAASALNHPHVATVYEVGEAEGRGYIAMECVEGRALSEQIPVYGLPSETVTRYGEQIAAALAHAHERGVVHRDLKSANIVITPQGSAKVLDFGLASRVQSEISEATRSIEAKESAASVAGTLHYMAPEVLRGEPADARSDLWSLGVVLYEMGAGKLPFQGRTGFELTAAILREPLVPLPAHVPPGIRGVIQRCLAKDPGHRYRSAMQVHAALEALGSDSAVAASAAAVAPQSREPRRIPRWAQITGAAIVLAGLFYAGRFALTPRSPAHEAGKSAPAAGPRLSTGGPASAHPEANEYFERGILFLKSQFDLQRSRKMFEEAIARDPKFGEARAWHAFTSLLMVDGGISNDTRWLYQAETELQAVLKDNPDLGRVHSALAGVYFYQGRMELMPGEVEKALRLNPQDFDAKLWLAQYYEFREENDKAKALAREILQTDPLIFPARLMISDILRTEGDSAGAIHEASKVLEQDAGNVAAIWMVARAKLEAGDLPGARRALEGVRPSEQQNFVIRAVRACLYAAEGKRAQARREMDAELLKFFDASKLHMLGAAEVYALLGESDRALEWFERAVRSGDERPNWFRRDPLLAKIRDNPRFQQILDSIAFRRGGRTAAPAAPRLSTGGRPSANAEANEYFERGRAILMARQGDLPRARKMFDRALELDPRFAEARAWRGFLYFLELDSGASNDPSLLYRAEEELRHALRDDPDCARAHSALAAVYHLQRRKELVPAAAETALRLNPDDLDARIWLMHYHRLNGDYNTAMALAKENLRRNPLFWPSRMNLGELFRYRGDYAGALREQNKVLEQDPHSLYALRNVARVYFDQGDLRRARATLERVPPENRRNFSVRATWAVLYALEGKRQEALQEWDADVVKSFEWDAMGAINAAEFYAVVGDSGKALDWLDRAVRNGDERAEWFRRDPLLANIRQHPRFKQILDSIAFRRQQRSR